MQKKIRFLHQLDSLSSQLFQFVTAQVLNFEHEHVSQILKNLCWRLPALAWRDTSTARNVFTLL